MVLGRASTLMVAITLIAAFAGGLAMAPRTALVAHEPGCYNAFLTGNYNVIVGAGVITGTSGNDLIVGSAGADTIDAGSGDDIVCGQGGDDTIYGGNGVDALLGDVCESCEMISDASGTFAGPNGAPGRDTIYGGNGDDFRIWGDELDDRLFGENGDDALVGGNPGGDGDETDLCDGGRGTDTATRCDLSPNVP